MWSSPLIMAVIYKSTSTNVDSISVASSEMIRGSTSDIYI